MSRESILRLISIFEAKGYRITHRGGNSDFVAELGNGLVHVVTFNHNIGGICLRTPLQAGSGGTERPPEFWKFINALNKSAEVSRFYVDGSTVYCEAWMPEELPDSEWPRFFELHRRDIAQIAFVPESNRSFLSMLSR